LNKLFSRGGSFGFKLNLYQFDRHKVSANIEIKSFIGDKDCKKAHNGQRNVEKRGLATFKVLQKTSIIMVHYEF